ncbi:hypothetical protein ACOTV5_02505 [Aliarcobacter butzleri]
MKDKYSTIKIIKDDKYFEDKEVKEQLKKMKKLITKIKQKDLNCLK